MTAQNPTTDRIYFESVSLFKRLIENNQLKHLISVKSNPYPTYCFRASKTVSDIVGAFMVEHGMKCDRTADKSWEDFENTVIKSATPPETIITRNFRVVKRILSDGYGNMLKRTLVDKHGKKAFVFYSNEHIAAIKAEEDANSRKRYEEKLADKNARYVLAVEAHKKKADTQISQLIRGTMEVQNNDK